MSLGCMSNLTSHRGQRILCDPDATFDESLPDLPQLGHVTITGRSLHNAGMSELS